jgi:hypothetical protein
MKSQNVPDLRSNNERLERQRARTGSAERRVILPPLKCERRLVGLCSWAMLIALCLGSLGCSSTTKLKATSLGSYPPSNKIPLSVELRMSDEYRKATWSQTILGMKSNIAFGDALTLNTEEFVRGVFAQCLTTSARENAPLAAGTKVAVVPQVTEVSAVIPGGGLSKIVTTLAVEMALLDGSGKTIWIESFKTESRGATKSSSMKVNKHFQERFDFMIKDVFQQAFSALSNSPEIKRFAADTDSSTLK